MKPLTVATAILILAALLTSLSRSLAHEPQNAIQRLNYQRAQQGLYAYQSDAKLLTGALAVVRYRAANRIHGHSRNDFSFLPAGANAPIAGCAAWPLGSGFGACGSYGRRYRYCGAAWCIGTDGLVYCHAFYR